MVVHSILRATVRPEVRHSIQPLFNCKQGEKSNAIFYLKLLVYVKMMSKPSQRASKFVCKYDLKLWFFQCLLHEKRVIENVYGMVTIWDNMLVFIVSV